MLEVSSVTKAEINVVITSLNHIRENDKRIVSSLKAFKTNSTNSRFLTSDIFGFSINEDRVQVINSEGFTTYAFYVYRDNPEEGILENYICKVFDDNSYEQYLLKYHYAISANGEKVYNTQVLDIEIIDGDNLLSGRPGCFPEFVEVLDDIVCTENTNCTGAGNHSEGQSCNCTPSVNTCDPAGSTSCNVQYTWVYQDCGGGVGGNIPSGNGDNNNNTVDGGVNTNNTTNPNNQTTALPIEPSLQEQILSCLNGITSIGTDNTYIDPLLFGQISMTKLQWAAINNNLQQNNCSEEAQQEAIEELMYEYALSLEFESIKELVPNAQKDRFRLLKEYINDNPWALVQDCAEENGMDTQNYVTLYNHDIPTACQTKLNELNGSGSGYSNQPFSDGNVPCANIDYYGVEITNTPDFNQDGLPDTISELNQAFKAKFTEFASGEKEDFQSTCEVPLGNANDTVDINWEFEPMTDADSDLFVSNNPITSIFYINAGADNFLVNFNADQGAVMVSGSTSNDFIVSTIQTPATGTQPFSGNRQWGFIINEFGNIEFYTRAVDVARVDDEFLGPIGSFFNSTLDCQQSTYYDIADVTWQNMQAEVAAWLNGADSNGGAATVLAPKTARVEKEKIKEILCTNQSIAEILSCD